MQNIIKHWDQIDHKNKQRTKIITKNVKREFSLGVEGWQLTTILGGPALVPSFLLKRTSCFFCILLMCASFFLFSLLLPATAFTDARVAGFSGKLTLPEIKSMV